MKKNLGMLTLIMAFWFTISFITNILGPLIPDIIHNFNLSDLAMAGFIPTSFFLAYAIMSIPAGLLIDRFGEKPVLFGGFLMPFIGTILFACMHTYPMLLASSFIIGLGMAMLQTVLNPLQRTVGGEENYAFIAELAQFMFGIASFLSPLVYTYLIRELDPATYTAGKGFFIDLLADVTPREMPWVSLYWVFTILLLVMLIAVGVSRFPKIELKEDEKSGSKDSYLALFKQKYVWLFFLGIFCYVSTEQGTSIFMSTFLEQYHGVNPQTEGAQALPDAAAMPAAGRGDDRRRGGHDPARGRRGRHRVVYELPGRQWRGHLAAVRRRKRRSRHRTGAENVPRPRGRGRADEGGRLRRRQYPLHHPAAACGEEVERAPSVQ